VNHARRKVLAGIGMAITLTVLGAGALPAPASASQDSDEWEFVCMINSTRLVHGRSILRVTPGLRTVARSWANTLRSLGYLAHNPNLSSTISNSVTGSWQGAGENVGYGYSVPSLFDAFMSSPSHRGNILSSDWEYIGVGVATGSPMWTSHEFLSSSASLSTVSDPYHSFVDVCGTNPFFVEIEWMADQDISNGYSDGSYRPMDVVTRQSMSAFMYRMAGSPAGTFPDPGFTDVQPGAPFRREIAWMASTGITTGYEDGTFRPGGQVSREAMSAFMYRLEDPPGGASYADPGFTDVSPNHFFAQEIAWMASAGITNGYADDTYRPGAPVSRQAMSAFMQRLSRL